MNVNIYGFKLNTRGETTKPAPSNKRKLLLNDGEGPAHLGSISSYKHFASSGKYQDVFSLLVRTPKQLKDSILGVFLSAVFAQL